MKLYNIKHDFGNGKWITLQEAEAFAVSIELKLEPAGFLYNLRIIPRKRSVFIKIGNVRLAPWYLKQYGRKIKSTHWYNEDESKIEKYIVFTTSCYLSKLDWNYFRNVINETLDYLNLGATIRMNGYVHARLKGVRLDQKYYQEVKSLSDLTILENIGCRTVKNGRIIITVKGNPSIYDESWKNYANGRGRNGWIADQQQQKFKIIM